MSRNVTHDGGATLQVRFAFDRELVGLVKTLPHRRWNAADRIWTVPDTDAVLVVDLLEPHGFRFDRATCELYRGLGGRRPIDATDGAAPASQRGLFDEPAPAPPGPLASSGSVAGAGDWTVSGLNERVRDALRDAFPSTVWLVGEISGFDKSAHRRVVSFQLVERGEDGSTVSCVAAALFESGRQQIETALSAAGDPFRLEDELSVRVRVSVGLYVPWGQYRVVVEDIDLNYTLGEAARRREEIVRRLAALGLTGRNPALPLPAAPLRVGLVTSLGSDAYNDVLRTLAESGYAFRVTAHGARVQGRATEPSVLNALDWFRARADAFDVVLICRGGGSRTDLVWFDSEPLGRAVATFPLPVIVGIGHEQDTSVLDAVARSCRTPTAAAAAVVDVVRHTETRLEEATRKALAHAARRVADELRRVRDASARTARAARGLLLHERTALDGRRRRVVVGARAAVAAERGRLARWSALIPRDARMVLARAGAGLDRAARGILGGARRDLREAAARVARLAPRLGPRAAARLERERERTDGRERRLDLVHPRRVVERGYAILRAASGPIVASPEQAPAGTAVEAELRGGVLRLRSEGKP